MAAPLERVLRAFLDDPAASRYGRSRAPAALPAQPGGAWDERGTPVAAHRRVPDRPRPPAPSGRDTDERYREWAAELPAILRDPGTRLAAHRAARMLGYAAGTLWGTALAPGSARRLLARMARIAAWVITSGLVKYIWIRPKTPQDWIYAGIGFLLTPLAISGCRFAYRRKRGKGRVTS